MPSSTSSNLFYVARDFEYVLRDSQGIRDCRSLHMAFANSKYTFRTRPLLHQLLWRQGEITVRAKAQLNGMKSDMIVQLIFPPTFYFGQFLRTFFMFN